MADHSGIVTLAAFDRLSVGWAILAAGLPWLDAAINWQAVRNNWTKSTLADIQGLAKPGEGFHYFAAIEGEHSGLVRQDTQGDSQNVLMPSGDRRCHPDHCPGEWIL